MDETSLSPQAKQLLALAGLLIVLVCIYTLVTVFITYVSTSVLHVVSSDPKATISIGQADHQTKAIGTGKTSVRLKPGTYQVAANNSPNSAVETVRISARQGADVSLKLSRLPSIRSVDDVDFVGADVFIDSGLTEEQFDKLKLHFFRFKTSAQVVNIDGASLRLIAHDKRSGSPFVKSFDLTIDSVPYKGVITYVGTESIALALYSPKDGSQVFDSTLNYKTASPPLLRGD